VAQASRLPGHEFQELYSSFQTGSPEAGGTPALLSELAAQLRELPDLIELIFPRHCGRTAARGERKGGLIREGFDANLDEIRRGSREGKEWIAKLQQDEIGRTGIPSLKVRFNSVFGYYIEVTKANLGKVPPHYVRKQTIANGERFITPELKEMEGKIPVPKNEASNSNMNCFCAYAKPFWRNSRRFKARLSRWRRSMCSPRLPRPRGCSTFAGPRLAMKAGCKSAKAGTRCWTGADRRAIRAE